MCGIRLKVRKRSMDLMFTLGLNETTGQLAMANSVRCYGHVLRRALDLKVQGRKGGQKGHGKGRLRKKV